MTRAFILLLGVLLVACASPAPTAAPTPDLPTLPPTAAPPSDLPTLPLSDMVAGIPAPGIETAVVEPSTTAGTLPIGEEQNYALGHCGLISSIDLDGSLWDPVAGDDGFGGPLAQPQLLELINSTPVVLVLVDHDTIVFATPLGARILMTRHDGARAYSYCD